MWNKKVFSLLFSLYAVREIPCLQDKIFAGYLLHKLQSWDNQKSSASALYLRSYKQEISLTVMWGSGLIIWLG